MTFRKKAHAGFKQAQVKGYVLLIGLLIDYNIQSGDGLVCEVTHAWKQTMGRVKGQHT